MEYKDPTNESAKHQNLTPKLFRELLNKEGIGEQIIKVLRDNLREGDVEVERQFNTWVESIKSGD